MPSPDRCRFLSASAGVGGLGLLEDFPHRASTAEADSNAFLRIELFDCGHEETRQMRALLPEWFDRRWIG